MSRVLVYYERYPSVATALRLHADTDSPADGALMPKATWTAIKQGQTPPRRTMLPPASDEEADPANDKDKGCGCSPEPEMTERS